MRAMASSRPLLAMSGQVKTSIMRYFKGTLDFEHWSRVPGFEWTGNKLQNGRRLRGPSPDRRPRKGRLRNQPIRGGCTFRFHPGCYQTTSPFIHATTTYAFPESTHRVESTHIIYLYLVRRRLRASRLTHSQLSESQGVCPTRNLNLLAAIASTALPRL